MSPAGFTRTPEVRALLDRYEGPGGSEGFSRFDGMTVQDSEKLLSLLPEWQAEDRQNFAPTFSEFVQLGSRYPGLRFQGYRVGPDREDERITIDGFTIRQQDCPSAIEAELAQLGAEDFYWQDRNGDRVLVVWWN